MILTAAFVLWVAPIMFLQYAATRWLPPKITNHGVWPLVFIVCFFGWLGFGFYLFQEYNRQFM